MNPGWFHALADIAMAMPVWPDERFPPSPYYRFFRALASNLHPGLSVELGVCGGGGSFHLAVGWPDGVVVGIENGKPTPQQRDNWHFIESFCPNFKLWEIDSVLAAPLVSAEYGATNILFIDTTHTYDQTMAEWNAWEPWLATSAVVMLDDLFRPGMEDAWSDIPWPNKLRLDQLHDGSPGIGGGFGVVWR